MSNILQQEGKRFKEFRLAENMTQREMAEVLDRTPAHIQKFEDCTRRIQVSDVKMLHIKLGMSYEWFYHGKGSRIYKEEKSTLVKDMSTFMTMIKILETKVDQMDSTVKKLVRDVYAKQD